jgi:hypothetical protein
VRQGGHGGQDAAVVAVGDVGVDGAVGDVSADDAATDPTRGSSPFLGVKIFVENCLAFSCNFKSFNL